MVYCPLTRSFGCSGKCDQSERDRREFKEAQSTAKKRFGADCGQCGDVATCMYEFEHRGFDSMIAECDHLWSRPEDADGAYRAREFSGDDEPG